MSRGEKAEKKAARKLISVKEVNEQNWDSFFNTYYNAKEGERERKRLSFSVKEFKSFMHKQLNKNIK